MKCPSHPKTQQRALSLLRNTQGNDASDSSFNTTQKPEYRSVRRQSQWMCIAWSEKCAHPRQTGGNKAPGRLTLAVHRAAEVREPHKGLPTHAGGAGRQWRQRGVKKWAHCCSRIPANILKETKNMQATHTLVLHMLKIKTWRAGILWSAVRRDGGFDQQACGAAAVLGRPRT